MADATLQAAVDELTAFKDASEDVLNVVQTNGSGGIKSESAIFNGELVCGDFTCSSLTVTGATGNTQFITDAEISNSLIRDSEIINLDKINFFKGIKYVINEYSTNYLLTNNEPSVQFYNTLKQDKFSTIDFFKDNIIYNRLVSSDEEFKIYSRNRFSLEGDETVNIFSRKEINLSLDTFDKKIIIQNPIHITSNINSTNINDGCMIIDGGIGIKKELNIGANINVDNNINVLSDVNSKYINVKHNININDICNVNGKLNITGNLNIDNNEFGENTINSKTLFTNETETVSDQTYSVLISGGTIIKKNLNVGNELYVDKNTLINSNLSVTSKIGIGTTEPLCSLDIRGTDAILLPSGNNSQRPNPPAIGMLRFNTDAGLEGYNGVSWDSFGGVKNADGSTEIKIVDDNLYFRTNNENQMVLSTNGRLGIGGNLVNDDYPSETLHIKGNVRIDGLLITNQGDDDDDDASNIVGNPTNSFDILEDSLNITENTSISNAFYNTEDFILNYFVKPPPAPVLNNITKNISNIIIDIIKPQQYSFGFTEHLLPLLSKLNIDYKKQSDSNYTSAYTNNTDITKIKIILDVSENFVDNDTFNVYLNDTTLVSYDFRIYYTNNKNNDTNRNLNYLELLNNIFIGSGVPEAPTNLTSTNITQNSISISFDKPNDHDINTLLVQSTPLIKDYSITYNTVSTIRNSTLINQNQTNLSILGNLTHNAPTNYIIYDLNPGHNYNINVKARNRVNTNYSSESNILNITTLIPSGPNYLNSTLEVINFNNYLYNNKGSININNNLNIINSNLTTTLETNTIQEIRLNYDTNSSNTSAGSNITQFIINDNTNDKYSIYIFGFGSITSNKSNNNLDILFFNEKDYYTESNLQGFYKVIDIKLRQNNLIPRIEPYYFSITQKVLLGGNTFNTNNIEYYVDNLSNLPEISLLEIVSFETEVFEYISGIKIYNENTIINFTLIVRNIGSYFIRSDYLCSSLYLSDIDGNVFSDELQIKFNDSDFLFTPNIYNYNTNNLPYPEYVTINGDITLKKTVGNYTNNLQLKSKSYNLLGESNFIIDNNASKPILIDLASINTVNTINNNDNYGIQVKSGIGQYPIFGTNVDEFGDNYDHTTSLLIIQDMQLINGYFTPPDSNYLDYSNYIGNSLNYTSIVSNNDYRYVTFKYNIEDISPNIDKSVALLKLELLNSINFTNQIENDINIYVKIYNTDSNSNHNTIWLDGNSPISPLGVNINNSGVDTGVNGLACLSISGNYKSTSTIKYLYVPIGSKGTIYLRFGIKNNSTKKIQFLKITGVI